MRIVLGAALLAALATAAVAQAPQGPPPAAFTIQIDAKQVVWTRLPTGEDVARLYPRKALVAMINVSAVVDCTIHDGVLENCAARDEIPMGYGVGEAAIALVQLSHMQMTTSDGKAVEGGRISLPVAFKMPPSENGQGV